MDRLLSHVQITPTLQQFFGGNNLRILSHTISGGRLLYGPDKDCDYGYLEAGDWVVELGTWPSLWLRTAWSSAEVSVWSGANLAFTGGPPKIGTTFKGGSEIELAPDGTPSQVSTTVIGTRGLVLSQDPRNDPRTIIWVSTHIEMLPTQKTPYGKPIPGCGPPGGVDKRFPLLYNTYLPIEGFNAALWAWMEPGQNVGKTKIFFVKSEYPGEGY